MNKKWLIGAIVAVVLLGALVGVAFKYGAAITGELQACVENWKEYQLNRPLIECVNTNEKVTVVGVKRGKMKEQPAMIFTISTTARDIDSVVDTYQHMMRCALQDKSWEILSMVDIDLIKVTVLEHDKPHYVGVIFDQAIVTRAWAEKVAAAQTLEEAKNLMVEGMENGEMGYAPLRWWGFRLDREDVNGDLGLAIKRWEASLEK